VRRAAILLCLLLGGCSLGGDDERDESRADRPTTVQRTKVQVVESQGGGMDATALYERLSPGVVTILSRFKEGSLLGQGSAGLGSGFVIDEEGHIATNAHVITTGQPPRLRRAREVFVELADGDRVEAEIVGADPESDVGLVKIDPGGLSLTPLRLGSSARLRVGSPVAAIGSPFGERQSLSVGVISAVDRAIESLTAFRISNAIQTDAAINQGNSGGPLLGSRGEVIGINAQIKSESGGGEGVGFAVPVDTARRSLDQLREDGKVEYGFVGVSTQDLYPQLAEHLDLEVRRGALVAEVEKDGPADDAGIEAASDTTEFQGVENVPKGGDVIVGVEGRPVRAADDLSELVALRRPGSKVTLEVERDGGRRDVEVTLEARPDRPPRTAPRR
jgi:S1-C subfamily serine protease